MERRTQGWCRFGLAALTGLLVSCSGHRDIGRSTRNLAEHLVLGPEWTELEANPPLVVRRAGEELVLHHSTDLTLTRAFADEPNAVYCPMLGETIRFDAELVGRDGSRELLGAGGISPGRLGMRPLHERFPSGFEVTRVRLRSNRPLEVSKLEWRTRTGSEAIAARR
jgi:hypothetical protein